MRKFYAYNKLTGEVKPFKTQDEQEALSKFIDMFKFDALYLRTYPDPKNKETENTYRIIYDIGLHNWYLYREEEREIKDYGQ